MTTNDNKTQVFTLRINTKLLNTIKAVAEQNKRSTAKEIEFTLEKFYLKN